MNYAKREALIYLSVHTDFPNLGTRFEIPVANESYSIMDCGVIFLEIQNHSDFCILVAYCYLLFKCDLVHFIMVAQKFEIHFHWVALVCKVLSEGYIAGGRIEWGRIGRDRIGWDRIG